MFTIHRTVTIQLQHFLPYMNLAFKNSYCTGIWLSNIIKLSQMEELDDLLWKTTFSGTQPSGRGPSVEGKPSVKNELCWVRLVIVLIVGQSRLDKVLFIWTKTLGQLAYILIQMTLQKCPLL